MVLGAILGTILGSKSHQKINQKINQSLDRFWKNMDRKMEPKESKKQLKSVRKVKSNFDDFQGPPQDDRGMRFCRSGLPGRVVEATLRTLKAALRNAQGAFKLREITRRRFYRIEDCTTSYFVDEVTPEILNTLS